jgi:hypothetical protein
MSFSSSCVFLRLINWADYAPIGVKLPRIYQKTKGYTDFVIVESLLRQTAQEQAKAEKAFEVTRNCTNFVHKGNYNVQHTFCKCFLEDFSALDTRLRGYKFRFF